MMQIIPMTKDEKVAMYMKLTKKELAEMLYNCNILLGDSREIRPVCFHDWEIILENGPSSMYTRRVCRLCGCEETATTSNSTTYFCHS